MARSISPNPWSHSSLNCCIRASTPPSVDNASCLACSSASVASTSFTRASWRSFSSASFFFRSSSWASSNSRSVSRRRSRSSSSLTTNDLASVVTTGRPAAFSWSILEANRIMPKPTVRFCAARETHPRQMLARISMRHTAKRMVKIRTSMARRKAAQGVPAASIVKVSTIRYAPQNPPIISAMASSRTTTDSHEELMSSHRTNALDDKVTLATRRSFMYSSSSTGVSAPASWRLRVSPRFSSCALARPEMVLRALSVLMHRMVRTRTAVERRPIIIQAQRYMPAMLQVRPSTKSQTVATKNPIRVITNTTSSSKLVHRKVYMLMGANSPATTTDTGGIAALFSAALSSTAKSSLASLMSSTLKRSRETSLSSRPRKSRLPDWRCSRRFCRALRTLSCFRISGVTYRAPFSASSFACSASPMSGSTGKSSSSLSGSSSNSRFRASWSIFLRSSRVGSWLFL
mmetsp:Transcript_10452/g.22973  ORF Transcript_10452/g.22973 Transcript_10452/m.22973 type:complete len:461 (-) Transcript_10452:282-1664(-)